MTKKFFLLIFVLQLLALSSALRAENMQAYEQQLIVERIKPVGQVKVQGASLQPPAPLKQQVVKNALLSGVEIYNKYCVTCHAMGLAGAPKTHNQTDWQPRLTQAGGIDALVEIAIKGINAMPAKGTCSECTKQQLKAALEYMLAKSS